MSKNRRLFAAINSLSLEEVRNVLVSGCDVNKPDRDGNFALHRAAFRQSVDIVSELLEMGADPDARGYAKETPLMKARCEEVARLLVDRGATIDATDEAGMTPLMHAANLDAPEVVSFLIERGADVNARSRIGATPLIYAVYSRSMSLREPESCDVVDLLISGGADLSVKDNNGITALGAAKQAEQCEGKGNLYVAHLRKLGCE